MFTVIVQSDKNVPRVRFIKMLPRPPTVDLPEPEARTIATHSLSAIYRETSLRAGKSGCSGKEEPTWSKVMLPAMVRRMP